MILPVTCTCGKPIAHLWFIYKRKVAQHQETHRKNIAEGNEELNDHRTPEAQALDELLIHKYCCRRMFLCQPDGLVDMITNRVE